MSFADCIQDLESTNALCAINDGATRGYSFGEVLKRLFGRAAIEPSAVEAEPLNVQTNKALQG
ncbi:hypothetical protein [Pseudomonas sp. Marseille-QA0892]